MYSRAFLIGLAICATWLASSARANDRDLIGYTDLAGHAGALQANGAGIAVAQVEAFAASTSDYSPDTAATDFAGKTFTNRSGTSGISGHATQVAMEFYGASFSPAPGISAVSLFSAESFVSGLLRQGRSKRAPGGVGAAVVNNSWIATLTDDAANVDTVRRLDDLINRDDVLVFNAVSTSATDPFPLLLASSFNGVSVGTLTGSHGPLTFDSPMARIKPDLVVDTGITSNSSALAAGAGALLRSEASARGLPAGELATKAILMAGALRDATWHRGRLSGKDNTTAPLDFQQGAGQLRVDQSFDILTAGQQPAGRSIATQAGWDYARTARSTRNATYLVHVDHTLPSWSVFLTWNRLIAGLQPNGHYSTAPTTADFALSLYLHRKSGNRLIATSDSPGDNVESLTLTGLPPGDYRLVLTSDIRSYYAMAWVEDGVSSPNGQLSRSVVADEFTVAKTGTGLDATAMPEPSIWGVLLGGLGLYATRRRHSPIPT